jgi:hypothetical protein
VGLKLIFLVVSGQVADPAGLDYWITPGRGSRLGLSARRVLALRRAVDCSVLEHC